MYPNPQTLKAKKSSTLREFIEELGADILYAYDRRVIVVLVNGELRWPSAKLEPGDKITLFPIITGG